MEGLFHNADENELDLLQRLMEFDPSKRITAQEGVKHPYCVQFHDAAHEPVAAEKVSIMIDDNEKKSTSVTARSYTRSDHALQGECEEEGRQGAVTADAPPPP